jgi:hypothetical protein
MRIRSISAGVLAATLTFALPMTAAWAANRSDAEQAIAAAKAAQQAAEAAGGDTSEAARLIDEAKGLLPSRQYTKAIDMATMAKKQGEYALSKAVSKAGSQADSAPGAAAESKEATEADQAIAAAEAARKKAASVGGEWRDTFNMIGEAKDLAQAGDFAGAIKLARAAQRQGELGYAQAMAETHAGFPSYMLTKKN